MSRNALGRGLSALIREPELPPPAPQVQPTEGRPATQTLQAESLHLVDIDLIDPSPYQPRVHFREAGLEELANSIRTSGIIQPLLLRRRGSRFQLIAGERRWRAAQRASLMRVPAVIRDVADETALEITLIENLQREDLNPIEQASAFERLMREFHLTQEEVAERTGKDRATVANAVRLLKLDRPIQTYIEEGQLSAGHGRALLSVEDRELRMALAKRAVRGAMTVRQIERLASRGGARAHQSPLPHPLDANTRAALEELQRELGTRVHLKSQEGNRPGLIMIEYYDNNHLTQLYARLMGR